MTTFIKTKFKISDDHTNIDKYRLSAKITVYHIISKLILQRIINGRPRINYRAALLFTRYLTAIGIIPESLKSIGQF